MSEELMAAKKILKSHRGWLLDKANVVATGVGFKVTRGQKTLCSR